MKAVIPDHLYNQAHHTPEQREKIKFVLDFYREFVLECRFDTQDKYLGDHYIQHNLNAPDGIDGLKEFLVQVQAISADGTLKFHRAFCDGDYVILHNEAKLSDAHATECVYDLFRLENGKVVEHWDAIVPVPETTVSGNSPF